MPDSAAIPPASPAPKSFFHKAASFCVWSPLIAIGVNLIMPKNPALSREDVIANVIVAATVPVAGVVAGLVALFGVRKYGKKGILGKSVAGLLIWALLAAAAIPVFQAVRDKARKAQEQRAGASTP